MRLLQMGNIQIRCGNKSFNTDYKKIQNSKKEYRQGEPVEPDALNETPPSTGSG
jgi:hypothetical protein